MNDGSVCIASGGGLPSTINVIESEWQHRNSCWLLIVGPQKLEVEGPVAFWCHAPDRSCAEVGAIVFVDEFLSTRPPESVFVMVLLEVVIVVVVLVIRSGDNQINVSATDFAHLGPLEHFFLAEIWSHSTEVVDHNGSISEIEDGSIFADIFQATLWILGVFQMSLTNGPVAWWLPNDNARLASTLGTVLLQHSPVGWIVELEHAVALTMRIHLVGSRQSHKTRDFEGPH